MAALIASTCTPRTRARWARPSSASTSWTLWREAPCSSERERAALAWCEALTLLPQSGAPDDVYAELVSNFDQGEIVALTLAVVAINGWNRLAVGLRSPVGDYVSPHGAG